MAPSNAGDCYDKPVWTIRSAARAAGGLPRQLARVAPTFLGRPIDGALRERVMLAVSSQNECRYCQAAHQVFGEAEGLTQPEMQAILAGLESHDGNGAGGPNAATALALRYVRDLTRRDFASRDEEMAAALLTHYTTAQRDALEATAYVMNFANRFGNTFDALLAHVTGGCETTEAKAADLAVISALFAGGAAVAGPAIAALGAVNHLRRWLGARKEQP